MSSIAPIETFLEQIPYLSSPENLQGVAKDIYPKIRDCFSIAVLEKFKEIFNITAVAIIGSTASGKTYLVQGVRDFYKDTKEIFIPKRYITRPARLGDDLVENMHITKEEFEKKKKSGEIGISWQRHMEKDRIENYGFESADPSKLLVLSANNDFGRSINKINKTILIVGVFCPDEIRAERLKERSPDMKAEEKAYRLGDLSKKIFPLCHLLIANYDALEPFARKDLITLISEAANKRVHWGEIRQSDNRRNIFTSRLFSIDNHEVLFSTGTIKTFEYVSRSPGVRVVIKNNDKILLTKEWREEQGKWDYRLPGGKVFETVSSYKDFCKQNPSSEALKKAASDTAKKEVQEEAGLDISNEECELSEISSCGSIIDWNLYFFTASTQKTPNSQSTIVTSEDEIVQSFWMDKQEVLRLCLEGKISEDRTVAFLLKMLLNDVKK